jgi:molybdenum cofactor guanylyltransferase
LPSDLLLALAIDLPGMNAPFLKSLLTRCSLQCGVVAQNGDFFEPLAAIYPKGLRVLAAQHLGQGCHAMQDLIREAVRRGLLQTLPLDKKDIPFFKNMNSPTDL